MTSSDRPDLLLAYDFPPIGGGIARMMAEIASRYPAPGLVVSTGAHPDAARTDAAVGCRVDRLAMSADRLRTLQGQLAWRRRARQLARTPGAGFVWCGNIRPAAPAARVAAARAGTGYGLVVHGGDLMALRRKAANRPLSRHRAATDVGGARWIAANSRRTGALAAELCDELGVPDAKSRITVVPLGSDPRRFRPDVDTAPLRERLTLPDGRWMLTVARLVPHKGVDVALAAFAGLAATRPDLHYAVAGTGPESDRLLEEAQRLGVAGRVHFLGLVPDESLPALYAMASVYVGLSREEGDDIEGFGIAIADASAAGRPVVAGKSGGTDEAVRDGETGVRVDPRSPADAARAIAALLDDPVRAREMGAAGRALVEARLNWDRVARDLAGLSRSGAASADRR